MTPRSALNLAILLALTTTQTACKRSNPVETVPSLNLKSSSFSDTIPNHFASCEGLDNESPELSWSAPPPTTQSFALIVTDPDAPIGTFTHWVLFDLPPDMRELPESIRKAEQLPNGSRQGTNDFGEIGYDGPCPPGHSTHRYLFDLYALDTKLNLAPGATKRQVLDAMKNHILAHGQLTARYQH